MAYAQRNYNEIQGINGKFRINQIGCFLVSFCNLLERFGRGVDPLTLNAVFRNRGVYIDVDDGIRDDLGWQSIVAYDGQINLAKTFSETAAVKVQQALIPSNNTIVRIAAGNRFGTHFCLVHDRRDGVDPLVIDSWDGTIKPASAYGRVTGWAEYGDARPQPVQPIVNPPSGPNYDGNAITIQVGWGLSHAAQAAGFDDWDTEQRWATIASLNGSESWRSYNSALRAGQRIVVGNSKPEPQPQPQPTTVTAEPEKTEDAQVEVKVASYKDSASPSLVDKYVAKEDAVVTDLDGVQPKLALAKGFIVKADSIFKKDGIEYVRTKKSAANGHWYGVPLASLTPLGTIDDVDDDDLFKIDMTLEQSRRSTRLSFKEKLVVFIARIHGALARLFTFWKRKNKKGA